MSILFKGMWKLIKYPAKRIYKHTRENVEGIPQVKKFRNDTNRLIDISSKNVFIIGQKGSGKTFLIKRFFNNYVETNTKTLIVEIGKKSYKNYIDKFHGKYIVVDENNPRLDEMEMNIKLMGMSINIDSEDITYTQRREVIKKRLREIISFAKYEYVGRIIFDDADELVFEILRECDTTTFKSLKLLIAVKPELYIYENKNIQTVKQYFTTFISLKQSPLEASYMLKQYCNQIKFNDVSSVYELSTGQAMLFENTKYPDMLEFKAGLSSKLWLQIQN